MRTRNISVTMRELLRSPRGRVEVRRARYFKPGLLFRLHMLVVLPDRRKAKVFMGVYEVVSSMPCGKSQKGSELSLAALRPANEWSPYDVGEVMEE